MLLQPFYFPWIGLFNMMSLCDTFIFYDDAQYSRDSRSGWDARNRIKTPYGVKWISISIDRHYKLGRPICEIKVNQQVKWRERQLNQLREAYKKAPYEIKRLYLGFFWDGFWLKDRKIVRAEPTKLIKALQNKGKIIIRSNWLRR